MYGVWEFGLELYGIIGILMLNVTCYVYRSLLYLKCCVPMLEGQ